MSLIKSKKFILSLVAFSFFLSALYNLFLLNQYIQKARSTQKAKQTEQPIHRLPVYGRIENFQLMDTDNQTFGLKNLEGKIWLADFVFTTCSGPCPILSANMRGLHQSFSADKRVAFVTISVNPEYDSSQILSAYAQRFSADTTQWHFLTGKREDIQHLAVDSFKVGSVDQPIFHSSYFILVDAKGYIRGYYEGTDAESIKKIQGDLQVLIKE